VQEPYVRFQCERQVELGRVDGGSRAVQLRAGTGKVAELASSDREEQQQHAPGRARSPHACGTQQLLLQHLGCLTAGSSEAIRHLDAAQLRQHGLDLHTIPLSRNH
jgi:hypothetical protein